VKTLVALLLLTATVATSTTRAASTASELTPQSLRHAQTIRIELDARYRTASRGGLAVTEASSTGVVESFTLVTSDLLGARVVSAENGIYYAVCPARASCPYPARRLARPAADLDARLLALELAVRTFLETSVDVVAVSLPTPRFIAFIVQRDELDLETVAQALAGEPSRHLSASVRVLVDRATRPLTFLATGLEQTPSGRDTWLGTARWPA
jgi:hypothetical protein